MFSMVLEERSMLPVQPALPLARNFVSSWKQATSGGAKRVHGIDYKCCHNQELAGHASEAVQSNRSSGPSTIPK